MGSPGGAGPVDSPVLPGPRNAECSDGSAGPRLPSLDGLASRRTIPPGAVRKGWSGC